MKEVGIIFRTGGISSALARNVKTLVGRLEQEGWSPVLDGREGALNYVIWKSKFKYGGPVPEKSGEIVETIKFDNGTPTQVEIHAYDPRLQEFLRGYQEK